MVWSGVEWCGVARNIDFSYWTVKQPGIAEVIWPEIGFGYGVTKRWYIDMLSLRVQYLL